MVYTMSCLEILAALLKQGVPVDIAVAKVRAVLEERLSESSNPNPPKGGLADYLENGNG